MIAAIVGIAGTTLSGDETALFRAHPPAGVILFARNITDPDGLHELTQALRNILPATAVLMVDQEGGRVARLKPPHWRAHPSAAAHGALFARDPAAGLRAAWITGALIGLDCAGSTSPSSATPWRRGCWPPASSRWASTRPGMAAPGRTAIWNCRW